MSKRAPRREVIGGWLSETEGAAFIEYATGIGIDSAALATLLLVRELGRDGLGALLLEGGANGPVHKERRVSARTTQIGLKKRFAAHAARHSVSSDAAAAAIFRSEIEEKWLGKCVGVSGNRVDSRSR